LYDSKLLITTDTIYSETRVCVCIVSCYIKSKEIFNLYTIIGLIFIINPLTHQSRNTSRRKKKRRNTTHL